LADQQLQAQVLAIWRQEKSSLKDSSVPPDQEARLVKELFDKQFGQQLATPAAATPGQAAAAQKPLTLEEMKQRLVAAMPMDEESLRRLVKQRADHIREQLVGSGKLAEERLFATDVNLGVTGRDLVRSNLSITAGS
jgi:hypothetical protein